jgi:hypothetical protein
VCPCIRRAEDRPVLPAGDGLFLGLLGPDALSATFGRADQLEGATDRFRDPFCGNALCQFLTHIELSHGLPLRVSWQGCTKRAASKGR